MISLDEAGRGLPWSAIFGPPGSLRAWVEHAWITRRPPGEGGVSTWKIVPDSSPNLLIHETGTARRVRLVGARSRAVDTNLSPRRWSVGIRFAPGTLPRLTGLPAHHLTDTGASPEELWGPAGSAFRQRLEDADGPEAALGVAFDFLAARVPPAHQPDWRARLVLNASAPGKAPVVGEVARAGGVSRRCLQDATRTAVGLTPKAVLRVHRLFTAMAASLSTDTPDWSKVAAHARYYDGAHLAREFSSLLGESPTRWRRRALADSSKTASVGGADSNG